MPAISIGRVRCGRFCVFLRRKTTLLYLNHGVRSFFLYDHSLRFVGDLYTQRHFCPCNSSIYEYIMQNQIAPHPRSTPGRRETACPSLRAVRRYVLGTGAGAGRRLSATPDRKNADSEQPKTPSNKRKSHVKLSTASRTSPFSRKTTEVRAYIVLHLFSKMHIPDACQLPPKMLIQRRCPSATDGFLGKKETSLLFDILIVEYKGRDKQ